MVLMAGTLSLYEIVQQNLTGLPYAIYPLFTVGGSIAFLIYLVAGVRKPTAPLIAQRRVSGGGYTEYSGLKWAMFFMAEYINMVNISALATVLPWALVAGGLAGTARGAGGGRSARPHLLSAEAGLVHLPLHLAARTSATPAFRPADEPGVESPVSARAGQSILTASSSRSGRQESAPFRSKEGTVAYVEIWSPSEPANAVAETLADFSAIAKGLGLDCAPCSPNR